MGQVSLRFGPLTLCDTSVGHAGYELVPRVAAADLKLYWKQYTAGMGVRVLGVGGNDQTAERLDVGGLIYLSSSSSLKGLLDQVRRYQCEAGLMVQTVTWGMPGGSSITLAGCILERFIPGELRVRRIGGSSYLRQAFTAGFLQVNP